MHHADPIESIHSGRVGMMHKYSAGELLAGAALVHHANSYTGQIEDYGMMPLE